MRELLPDNISDSPEDCAPFEWTGSRSFVGSHASSLDADQNEGLPNLAFVTRSAFRTRDARCRNGLSGGANPHEEGLLLVLSKRNSILALIRSHEPHVCSPACESRHL